MKFKKLSLLTSLAVAASMFSVAPASATETVDTQAAPTLVFAEDFEKYSAHETLLTGANNELASYTDETGKTIKWVSASNNMSSFGWDGAGVTGIAESQWTDGEATNKALKVEARAAYNSPAQYPAVVLEGVTLDASENYTIETDFKIGDERPGPVVRFLVHNDQKNYYELYLLGSNGNSIATAELTKCVNGSRTLLATKKVSQFTSPNTHYTLKINVNNGRISWIVIANDKVAVHERGVVHEYMDAVIDTNPFEVQDAQIALAAGGQGGQYAYYDNVKIYKNDVTPGYIAEETFDYYTKDDYNFDFLAERGNNERHNGILGSSWTTAPRYYANAEEGFARTQYSQNLEDLAVVLESEGSTNKVFKLESMQVWNSYNWHSVLLNESAVMSANEDFKISADIKKEGAAAGAGIKFLMHNETRDSSITSSEVGRYLNTYYELYFHGTNAGSETGNYVLNKVVGGVRTALYESPYTTKLPTDKWYNVEITYKKGKISWTVTDKSIGITDLRFCGVYEDKAPINTEKACKMAIAAGGQRTMFVYWDNIKVMPLSDEEVIFADNFNGYTAATSEDEYASGSNKPVVGNWVTKSGNFGYDNTAKAGIVYGKTGSNVMTIEGRSEHTANFAHPVVLNTDATVSGGDKYIYRFDICRTGGSAGGGIRFNIIGDNFYQLFFKGGNGNCTELKKFTEVLEPQITGTPVLVLNTVYSVEVTYENGKIDWVVTNKSTGEVFQTGTYTDAEPLEAENSQAGIFAGGQGLQYTQFDNVEIAKVVYKEPSYTQYNNAINVEFSPAKLNLDENAEKIQVIVAYYDGETKSLLSVETKEITDLNSVVDECFDANTTAGAYAKIYIWNGDVTSALPAWDAINVE